MSVTLAVMCPALTITDQNKGLRVVYAGVGYTCQLTAGTYYLGGVGSSLLAAIITAITAGVTGAPVFTSSISRNITTGSSGCSVTLTSPSSTWYFDVTNSAHTFDTTILGMSDTVNASAAVAQTSTQTVGGNWVSGETRTSDDAALVGGASRIIKLQDGSSVTHRVGSVTSAMDIEINLLERQRIWTDTVRATYHPAIKRIFYGDAFEYHETSISSGSTLTALSSSTIVGSTWKLSDIGGMRFPRQTGGTSLFSAVFAISSESAQ